MHLLHNVLLLSELHVYIFVHLILLSTTSLYISSSIFVSSAQLCHYEVEQLSVSFSRFPGKSSPCQIFISMSYVLLLPGTCTCTCSSIIDFLDACHY